MLIQHESVNVAFYIGLLILLWPKRSLQHPRRLRAHEHLRDNQGSGAGTIAGLATLSSMLRCGGNLVESVEVLTGRSFATRTLTLNRCYEVMWKCHSRDENPEQIRMVAMSLSAAFRLSEELGCEAARCIDAAAAACRRAHQVDELRNKAFSMPKATVKLLSALPIAAMAVAELIGVRALSFLFSTMPGLICLTLGSLCYILGVLWMHALAQTDHTDSVNALQRLGV